MPSWREDFRYGLRLLKRSPGFAAVTVLTLALGIGANTAIFTILDALVLRTLPVSQPERLVEVAPIYRNGSKVPISSALFQYLQQNQHVFSDLFAWTGDFPYNVQVDRRLFVAGVRGVSGNYYAVLGATPLLGRLIEPADAREQAGTPVAVIGYEFWDREFGRDPNILSKTIRIEGEPYTIVGVTRRWFTGMTPGAPADITIPNTVSRFANLASARSALWMSATARLRNGVTIEQAREQLGTFWRDALVATAPTAVPGPRLQSWLNMGLQLNSAATGINRTLRTQFERPLQILMALVILILLVACVNLANLMLARAAVREREMSVRLSVGATRLHIARQLLTESLLLSTAGAVLALAVATWASHLLVTMIGRGAATPIILDLRPDWRVFGFAALVAVSTGLLIGLAPAWLMSRRAPADALRADSRTSANRTAPLGKLLIIAQIALSFVLVVGAGLLLRTFESLRSFDPQFQRIGVLQLGLQFRPNSSKYLQSDVHDVEAANYRKEIIDAVVRIPGVKSASYAGIQIPAGDTIWKDTVSSNDVDSPADTTRVATLVIVSPEFFQTLGIPILAGRSFDWNDDDHHPRVAIVDSNLARVLAPSGSVVGARVRFGVQPPLQDLQCVGVARAARLINLRDSNALVIYVPFAQYGTSFGSLFVRAENPAEATGRVQHEIESLGREYVTTAKTLQDTSDQALVEDQATATLSGIFAGLALLLAGIGLFGLMSYAVTRRRREIGIRMALGSQRDSILRMILRESIALTIAGLAIGVPCALAATRLIAHFLFGVTPRDPLTFLIAVTATLMVGAFAGWWPALRATKVHPIIALRSE